MTGRQRAPVSSWNPTRKKRLSSFDVISNKSGKDSDYRPSRYEKGNVLNFWLEGGPLRQEQGLPEWTGYRLDRAQNVRIVPFFTVSSTGRLAPLSFRVRSWC